MWAGGLDVATISIATYNNVFGKRDEGRKGEGNGKVKEGKVGNEEKLRRTVKMGRRDRTDSVGREQNGR